MNVLVINAGSSSLKYQLVNVERHELLAKGICERVGSAEAFHKHGLDENEVVIDARMADHDDAMALVLDSLTEGTTKAIDSLDEIDAVGHRIVQGGKYFERSVLIDDDVIAKIDELAELAPLHNKAALMGINACLKHMPDVPMVAVFDTSFFQTLPPKAYMYPLPYELYEKYAIRKYGAHGTSHRYISERAAVVLDEPLEDLKLITCHLGNGCSMSAIDHGVAVDTSMGLTPLDGLMMGTRCGAIDPAIVPFVMEHENLTARRGERPHEQEVGPSGHFRHLQRPAQRPRRLRDGKRARQLAYDMYSNSVKKHIGSYIAVMGGVDAIVLTAGVGENCEKMRRMIFTGLQPLGIILDEEKNRQRGFEREISADNSPVKIIIIPTNEEYMIARDTYEIVHEKMRVAKAPTCSPSKEGRPAA